MEGDMTTSDRAGLLIGEGGDLVNYRPTPKDSAKSDHQDHQPRALPMSHCGPRAGSEQTPENGDSFRRADTTASRRTTSFTFTEPGTDAVSTAQSESFLSVSRSDHPGSSRQGSGFAPLQDTRRPQAPEVAGKTPRQHAAPLGMGLTGRVDDARAGATMASEDDDKTAVTYVIEEGGTVSMLNRLSLDSEGEGDYRDGGKRPVAMAHCHVNPRETGVDKKARFKLILASLLCLVFMIGECVGGVLAHSLAVVSDAAHLLTDFASFMISLMALYLASRPATKRLSFGWHRAEILGALVSILMLWVITGVLAYSAVLRIQSGDYEIDATIMLITSATGVVFNVVLGCTLHQHGHSHGHGHGHSHQPPSPSPPSSPTRTPLHRTSLALEQPDESPLIGGNTGPGSRGYGSLSRGSPADLNGAPGVFGSTSGSDWGRRGRAGEGGVVEEEEGRRGKGSCKEDDEECGGGGGGGGGRKNDVAPTSLSMTMKKKKKKDSNINVKAAFIHVVGDFCQSVGVLIAAFIIFFKPEWKIADPICTFLFSALVLITTITILRDILVVLMEGTPRNINFEEVRDSILNMEGVKDLHDLRVWSLTMNKTALSVHLAVERGMDPMKVVQSTSRLIQHQYNITQTTIQVEEFVEEMRDCSRCQDLKD